MFCLPRQQIVLPVLTFYFFSPVYPFPSFFKDYYYWHILVSFHNFKLSFQFVNNKLLFHFIDDIFKKLIATNLFFVINKILHYMKIFSFRSCWQILSSFFFLFINYYIWWQTSLSSFWQILPSVDYFFQFMIENIY